MSDSPKSPDPLLVSAVIPTRGRPELLACAVRSALRQTWLHLEVIVVVDGPDPATEGLLSGIDDPRLRVILLGEPLGGGAARNAGIRAARGEWIALLDDDDEWLPEKIERQMWAAGKMRDWFPVISCRLIAQSPTGSRILPSRTYASPEPVADYLFGRTGFADPGGLMQTSTLLAPRELLLAVPFREDLPMHQDWDWVVRVGSHVGVAFSMVSRPLSIWRVEDQRSTVGRRPDWRFSLEWIRGVRRLISPQAYSWFVAVQCGWRAQSSRAGLLARALLLWAFLFEGRPGLRSFLHLFAFTITPAGLRRSFRDRIWRSADPADTSSGLHLVFARKPPTGVLRKSL